MAAQHRIYCALAAIQRMAPMDLYHKDPVDYAVPFRRHMTNQKLRERQIKQKKFITYTKEKIKQEARYNMRLNGTTIGHFGFNQGRIVNVYLQPKHRGQGYGKQMMQYALSLPECPKLLVASPSFDSDMTIGSLLWFYKSLGFKPQQVLTSNRILMQR